MNEVNKLPVIVTLYPEGGDSGSSDKSCEGQAQREAHPGEWQCLAGLWVVVRVSLKMQHWSARYLCGEKRPHRGKGVWGAEYHGGRPEHRRSMWSMDFSVQDG